MPPASTTTGANIMRNIKSGHRKSLNYNKFKKFEQRRMHLDTEDEPLNTQMNEEEEDDGMGIEHGTETRFYYSRIRLVDSALFCMAFMGMGLTALQYEISFMGYERRWGIALLWIIFISSIALALLVLWRYKVAIDFKIARKRLPIGTNIFNSGQVKIMLLECLIFFIHPSPFLFDYTFNVSTEYNYYPIYYHYNDILSAISFIRVIIIVRALVVFSYWNSNRAQRLCEMYNSEAGYWFGLKCMMEENPMVVVFTTYFLSLPILGFFLRIGERPYFRDLDEGNPNFNSYLDSIWCVLITLHTVGFGDYFAVTFVGRIVTFFMCIWGSFITSIMVVTMTRVFELKSLENKAYNLLKILAEKDKMRKESAFVFTKLAKLRFNLMRMSRDKIRPEIEDVKYHLKRFQGISRFYKEFSNTDQTVEGMKNRMTSLQNDMIDFNISVNYLIQCSKLFSNVMGVDQNVRDKFSFVDNKKQDSSHVDSDFKNQSKFNFTSKVDEFDKNAHHIKRVRTKPTSISDIKDLEDMY